MATATSMIGSADPSPREHPELYEVIDDRVTEGSPLGSHEVWLASELVHAIIGWEGPNRLGRVVEEALFVLGPRRRRRPDVAYVSAARWPVRKRVPRENAWDVVPDLAVEVVSPTDYADDLMEKIVDYFEAGVHLVWIVYPKQRQVYCYETPLSVRVLVDGDSLDGGQILPGFRLDVTDWFGEEEDGTQQEQPGT